MGLAAGSSLKLPPAAAQVPHTVAAAVEFERCKDQIGRLGYDGLDGRCRSELHGVMLMVFFLGTLSICGCIKICESCKCHEATTRRERVADTKAMSSDAFGNGLDFEFSSSSSGKRGSGYEY